MLGHHAGSSPVFCTFFKTARAKLKRIECDEIWSFVYAKERHLSQELQGVFGYGDVYTWVAIDADTKLVPCWNVGRRDAVSGMAFIKDLAARLKTRVQLSTDGFK